MPSGPAQAVRPGVYAPILTPFRDDGSEEVDLEAFAASVARLGAADVGIVLGGTLGEGPLLEREERIALIKRAKKALADSGSSVPVIAGVVGASVRECVVQAQDAASAGADAVIVVAPAYFAFVYGKDRVGVQNFFTAVADDSPLPVLIYNIPFAAGGIDLDAQALIDLSEHQNIAGVKLTCYNIAKGYRVALHVDSPEYKARHPLPFLVLPGSTDYLLPALIGRQHGCIGGPANLYPKTCVKIFRTATEALKTGDFELLRKAQELQDIVTEADSVINKVGFLGIKTAMSIFVDEKFAGGFRRPLSSPGDAVAKELQEGLAKAFQFENSL
ncbi:hypothetical protein VTK73DRAFT_9392 [Phialemonium thermophilum]|uniref:4-hydroxy-tetrahydrodipicolinate synthase n=1 Tax=Phialemonium thermophilum TaxID=223376 RepID=A0ABR3W2J2_9PEZI